ncbi:hypothetical protein MKW92_032069, partial [Papaver armeniacum]
SGGNGAAYSAEVTDRLVSTDRTRPGIRMQFKSSTQRISSSSRPMENSKMSSFAENGHATSSTAAVAGSSSRIASQPMATTETSTLGHASGGRNGHPSSWFPSLQRNSSAK